MDLLNNSNMIQIRDALENHGFDIVCANMSICVSLDWTGITNAVLEFYALRKSPEQVRARIRKNTNRGNSGFTDHMFHTEIDLEYMNRVLQEGLSGVAKVGRFFYFGYRKGTHCYYAYVNMSEKPEDICFKQKLLEKSLEQLKCVDSKIFRQGLDMSGLARSSIVRLALTRIFRSASDPEELTTAVSEEAVRIVNAGEWKTVRNLINSNRVNFLGHLVFIFWEEICRCYMKKSWEELYK